MKYLIGNSVRHSIKNEPFQLLLTDMHMPDRDGYGPIESVGRTPLRLAADHRSNIIQTVTWRCLKLRVSEHLTKPVKQSELFKVLVGRWRIEEQLVKTADSTWMEKVRFEFHRRRFCWLKTAEQTSVSSRHPE